jgi:lipoate synthase
MGVSLNHLVLSDSPSAEEIPRPGIGRKPAWLKMKMPGGEEFIKLLNLVNDQRLHTVCQSA